MTGGAIYTVGHSTHPIDRFLKLLRLHNICTIVDVRSSPYSRFNPQFNRPVLTESLGKADIRYLFMGDELGARVDDPSCYRQGRVIYSRLAARPGFNSAVELLMRDAQQHRTALMCAERESLNCHRTLLVTQALVRIGAAVDHIHWDGKLESHQDALDRLIDMVGLPREDLFMSGEELQARALARQEERIAYRIPAAGGNL